MRSQRPKKKRKAGGKKQKPIHSLVWIGLLGRLDWGNYTVLLLLGAPVLPVPLAPVHLCLVWFWQDEWTDDNRQGLLMEEISG